MSRRTAVYAAERAAGLEAAVLAQSSVALAAAVVPCDPFPLPAVDVRLAERARAIVAGTAQPDLHFFRSVLVTAGWKSVTAHSKTPLPAGWNRNDDFFDPIEVWQARATPEQKPVNHEHDCSDIIGHIVANDVTDPDGKAVANDAAADELPDAYNVVTGSVLYRIWDKEDLQVRMNKLLEEMAQGKWFVSMECHFRGFDYVVAEADGTFKAVARNRDTAFLTKHLRAYNGSGTYEGRRVGRLLRNINFSGMGVVRQPANPASVIFTASAAEKLRESAGQVYCTVSGEAKSERAPLMNETETLQKQLDALRAENDKLKAEARDSDVKQVVAAREKLEAEVERLKKALADSEEARKVDRAAAEKAHADLGAAEKARADAQARLDAIEAERRQAERLSAVKAALKVDGTNAKAAEAAQKLASSLSLLSDEQFKAHLEALSVAAEMNMMTKPAPTNNPQAGNTTFPHGKVSPVPSITDKPAGPKATSLPNPVTSVADVKLLDSAVTTPEPALGVETDKGAEGVRKAIASFFGCEEETR